MKHAPAPTVVESVMSVVLVAVIATAGYSIYQSLQTTHRDQERKVAINAIYHNLEEVVRPQLGAYPRVLSASQLSAIDPALLRDPSGVRIGEPRSDYRYEATGCNGTDRCSGYRLSASLERETDFIKFNRS